LARESFNASIREVQGKASIASQFPTKVNGGTGSIPVKAKGEIPLTFPTTKTQHRSMGRRDPRADDYISQAAPVAPKKEEDAGKACEDCASMAGRNEAASLDLPVTIEKRVACE
jgi:hypothetical protein